MNWRKITYPKPLIAGATIGITACSSGVEKPALQARLELLLTEWRARGFHMVQGQCLREDKKQISAPATERAAEFMKFWQTAEMSAIFPPWGGERLISILEHLDFEKIAADANPKWVLGYSDISTLLFALTLRTGIATAHGVAFMDLIESQTDGLTQKYLQYLSLSQNETFQQESFSKFQKQPIRFEEDISATFNLQFPVQWKHLRGVSEEKLQGRIIGGCLDTLMHLVGTSYGELPSFIKKFKDEGVVLYLENCEMNSSTVARALTQLKYAGWFNGLQGILMGRSAAAEFTGPDDFTEHEAVESVLGELNLPVLLDVDIGHRPPQMLIMNGSFAEIHYKNGSGRIKQTLL